ncbi:MAG: hypothetical protein GH155_01270 [Spirochaeta sp.]|nr:hypothetical protein [Spirochaeta sp.]
MHNRTAVVIHAHPDDTEIFCAGTLRLLKDTGYRLVIVTLTAGGMGGIDMSEVDTIALRKSEAEEAAALLEAKYYCLEGRDGYLFDSEELRIETTALIRREKAGMVFTHLPLDYHSDHRTTANIVESAAMLATLPNVPCKESPLPITPLLYHTAPLGFTDPLGSNISPPHFFIDISSTIDAKMEMLSYHKTQVELMRVMHRMDSLFDYMKRYSSELGDMVNVEYAEAFWQHLGGGFQKTTQLQEDLKDYVKYR